MSTPSYHTLVNRERTIRLRQLSQELPLCCNDFFRGLEPTTSVLTRLNYAYDLRLFFQYLLTNDGDFSHLSDISQITLDDLKAVQPLTIEMFLEYLTYYQTDDGKEYQNGNAGKSRKLATLKSFFKYLYKREMLPENVAEKVDMPKVAEKPIIRLEPDEVARMLDAVDSGEVLTERQKRYHRFTRSRDVAIFSVLLGTGIRISELVGLDANHVDFSANSFLVTRKGGAQVVLYFGQEVEQALLDYLEDRKHLLPEGIEENALFLSLQKKRMSQRAIQLLVKKYANIITPLKKISPHKFRSTFGTMLNYETGDIYLVADVLGNKDVNTTRRHYAALSDDKRRIAASAIKLRDDDTPPAPPKEP
ncbi:tyrosine-type recombinase/integrase [Eubacteriales bacterium OttesenSCG-928-M02]|nr:tyrosine-type recombinase/integrase [Eubacteriales bacterium OttesenSCG-928-M02]